ncbi:MAG: hypothetical protein AAB524_00360 [Patescibacteria group bacterium]
MSDWGGLNGFQQQNPADGNNDGDEDDEEKYFDFGFQVLEHMRLPETAIDNYGGVAIITI